MSFDHTGFLLDGATTSKPGVQLWVSDDGGLLADRLKLLAGAIVEGKAPEALAGEQLLRLNTEELATDLAGVDDPVAAAEGLLAEIDPAKVILALPDLADLLESGSGRAFLDGLCAALRNNGVKRLIGLTNQAGLKAIKAQAPQFAAFFTALDLDDGSEVRLNSVAIRQDSDSAGWVVAVHCRLTAEAPVLEGLQYGVNLAVPGTSEQIQGEGVESVFGLRQREGAHTIVITLEADAGGIDEPDRAEQIAADAARRLLGRPLGPAETMEATRLIYFVAPSDG
jgi:hypothetical protein